ncbi:MAG: O-antigen ligase family protein [Pirellulaceae bacterium]
MTWLERVLLGIAIFEIPLEIDKYFLYDDHAASWGAVGGINISVTLLCMIALYGIWFSGAAVRRSLKIREVTFGLPMVFYLGAIALSVLPATKSMLVLFEWWLVGQAFMIFFYIANRIRTRDDLFFCVMVLAGALLFQALLIFGMFATGIDADERSIGPLHLTVWEGKRQAGTMQSPVLAGSTMALIWLPVATAAICPLKKWASRFLLLAAVAGMVAILLTQTRGAILTSAIGCLIIGVGLFSRRWLPRWTIAAAAVLAMLSLYPLYILYDKRIREGDGESAIARKHMSLMAMEMIADRPFIGYGSGNCHIAGLKYANQGKWRGEWYYTIHSKYLLVWIETGILGIGTFLAILINGLRQGMSVWLTRRPMLAPIGLALAAAIVGHGLHMSVDIFNSRMQVHVLWTILAIAAAAYRLAHEPEEQRRGKISRSLNTQAWIDQPASRSVGGIA